MNSNTTSVADAGASELGRASVEKTRHHLDLPGERVVDCLPVRMSLVLLEVELPAKDTAITVPDWCADEITGLPLGQCSLAQQPLQSWAAEDRVGLDWSEPLELSSDFLFRFKQEFRWPASGGFVRRNWHVAFCGQQRSALTRRFVRNPLSPCSLQMLPEPVVASIRVRGGRHLEGRSS